MRSKEILRVIGISVFVLVFAFCSFGGVATAKTYNFRMATFYSAGDPAFNVINHFIKLVEEKTKGQVKIEAFQGGELGFPVTEIVDATGRGVVDLAIFYTSYLASQNPVMALAGGRPGPATTPNDLLKEVEGVKAFIAGAFEKFGTVYIGPMIYGNPEILVTTFPVKKLSDLKGKILRSSGLAAVFYTKFGAQAIMMPGGELYQALQLGTIDGLEWTDFAADYRLGFYEVAKYALEPTPGINLHSAAAIHAFLIFNPSVWKKLPEDLKKAVKDACYEAYNWSSDYVVKLNKEYKKKWIESGGVVTKLSKEDNEKIVKVACEVLADYSKKSKEATEYMKTLLKVWEELGYKKWVSELKNKLK